MLTVVATDHQEGSRWNSQSQNSAVPRINEKYIAKISEGIKGRVKTKLSQKFKRTDGRFLYDLSKGDEFFMNPQVRVQSGTGTKTYRKINVELQERTGDRSQSDRYLQIVASTYQTASSDHGFRPSTKIVRNLSRITTLWSIRFYDAT